jgi:hypothetical protein
VRQPSDAHVCHSDNVGRSSSSAGTTRFASDDASQGRVRGTQNDSDEKRTAHEEDCETPVDGLEGGLDIDARTPCFTSDHGKVFGSSDAERGRPQSGAESFELAESASAPVLFERVVVPVPESVCIMLWVAAAHCDECEGEYDQDQDDLAAGQPEFSLTEDLDGKNVEDTVKNLEVLLVTVANKKLDDKTNLRCRPEELPMVGYRRSRNQGQ